ncbi:hypothetical protein [Alicyclobacillus fodiniaquatilis]|uniref:Uncharacterized protein n=1 Tax=Alicyclobacillus fodiniaquatilis TaxID=1661150 RepID=A0ABW4JGT4_9BACL
MTRPTVLIREVLLLQLLEETVHKELMAAKRVLQEAGVEIIESRDTVMDVHVQYRFEQRLFDGIYIKRMLDAEARGYLKHLPNIRRHLGRGMTNGKVKEKSR